MYNYKIDNELEELTKELDSYRPLPKETTNSLTKHLMLMYNQESNAIEGNSLTISETKVLLENGITAKGKPFKDHLDIINHQKAIEFLNDLVREKSVLSESDILNFHYLLLKGTESSDNAGVYRKVPVIITGTSHQTTPPFLIKKSMEDLLLWHNEALDKKINPVIRGAILHTKFARIHPFIDGNGRTARLLLNTELLKAGYPIAIIKKDSRAEYYDALESVGKAEDFSQIINFIQDNVKETTKFMLNIARQTNDNCNFVESKTSKSMDDLKKEFNEIFSSASTDTNKAEIKRDKQ